MSRVLITVIEPGQTSINKDDGLLIDLEITSEDAAVQFIDFWEIAQEEYLSESEGNEDGSD